MYLRPDRKLPVRVGWGAFPTSNINLTIDYSHRGGPAVHVMAGSSGNPRIVVWIINKRLSCARAETVKFSSDYGCCVMINRHGKRLRQGPRVCGWIIDLHRARGVSICIITHQ